MLAVFLITVLGNIATIMTIKSDDKLTSYQYLQICLCFADMILAISGPLVSVSITLMFLTNHLGPHDFMDNNLFHQFQYAAEAVEIGMDNVIEINSIILVITAFGISVSTTVSILTIACMAILRWTITKSFNELLVRVEENIRMIIVSIWMLGNH